MIVTNYTVEDLKRLPLRAIVALSARCARRAEHLALQSDDHAEKEQCRSAITNAIRLAEDFANGLPGSSSESVLREVEACRSVAESDYVRYTAIGAIVLAARAAATARCAIELRGTPEEPHYVGAAKPNPFPHLADETADQTARDVFTAAFEAISSEGHSDECVKAAIVDYEKLLQLELGTYPQAGQPIDPSPGGPLGPLWPGA